MMRILTQISIVMLVLFVGQVFAQDTEMSKDEIKRWKRIAKDYKKNPAALKELTEERQRYKQESEQLQSQLRDLQSQQGQEDSQLAQKEQEIMDLNNQLLNAQSTIQQLREQIASTPTTPAQDDMMSGLVFRVQIGAYQKTRISTSLATDDAMKLEDEGGLQKILVGQFRDYQQAVELKDYMVKIGVKDAWVVPFRDGIRISLEEAGIN